MRSDCRATIIGMRFFLKLAIVFLFFIIVSVGFTNTAEAAPPKFSNSTEATFTFSSNESPVTFECSLNEAPWTSCSSPKNYTNLSEGPQTFRARATDSAGNIGNPVEYSWTIDTAKPVVSIVSGPDETTDTSIFTFEANESPVSYECRIDDVDWASCSSPKEYSDLSGLHRFEVRATDQSGNTSAPAAADWESNPAELSITKHPVAKTNISEASFEFVSNVFSAVYECSLDKASWSTCSSPQNYIGLADGTHNFRVRTTIEGVTSSRTWNWEINTVKPIARIISGPEAITEETTAILTFDADKEVTFSCRLDAADWTDCASAKEYSNMLLGEHIFEVRATDEFGNTSETEQYNWTVVEPEQIDTVTVDISVAPDKRSRSSSATFAFESSGNNPSYQCRLDNRSWKKCESPTSFTKLKYGEHTFRVRDASSAGEVASYSWFVLADNPSRCKISNVRSRFFVFNSRNSIRLVALYKAENKGKVNIRFYERKSNGEAGKQIASMKAHFRRSPLDYDLFRVEKKRSTAQMDSFRNAEGFVAKLQVKNAPGYCQRLYNLKLQLVDKKIIRGQQTFFQKGSFKN